MGKTHGNEKDSDARVPVTEMNPKGDVEWCMTKGWGDLSQMETGWIKAECFEKAAQGILAYAKAHHPARLREVWSYNYLKDGSGVVCDFGDYTYFGFVKGDCCMQAPAPEPEVPTLPPGRPEKECSAPEYLESDDGRKLTSLFNAYFGPAMPNRLSWWQSHALEYCLISEWWSIFSEEEPSIKEIWKHDLSPNDIYEHVLRWARDDSDGAEILLQSSPDARWDAFHRAFTWGEE